MKMYEIEIEREIILANGDRKNITFKSESRNARKHARDYGASAIVRYNGKVLSYAKIDENGNPYLALWVD